MRNGGGGEGGLLALGHIGGSTSGPFRMHPDPPAQFFIELATNPAPMHRSTIPVISLGKILMSSFGFARLSATWNSITIAIVPRSFPYAFGHGSFSPCASVPHRPASYSFEKKPCAIGTTENDSPTTESIPVPSHNPVLKIRKRMIWKKEKTPDKIREADIR